jgi:hypothetical protein
MLPIVLAVEVAHGQIALYTDERSEADDVARANIAGCWHAWTWRSRRDLPFGWDGVKVSRDARVTPA